MLAFNIKFTPIRDDPVSGSIPFKFSLGINIEFFEYIFLKFQFSSPNQHANGEKLKFNGAEFV